MKKMWLSTPTGKSNLDPVKAHTVLTSHTPRWLIWISNILSLTIFLLSLLKIMASLPISLSPVSLVLQLGWWGSVIPVFLLVVALSGSLAEFAVWRYRCSSRMETIHLLALVISEQPKVNLTNMSDEGKKVVNNSINFVPIQNLKLNKIKIKRASYFVYWWHSVYMSSPTHIPDVGLGR